MEETIISAMASRVQDATELLRQREKLAALGKLSAGLAHELNNPASAVLRSVQQLQANLAVERDLYRELTSVWSNAAVRRSVEDWVATIETRTNQLSRDTSAIAASPMDQSDREDRLLRWLEEREITDSSRLAPALAEAYIEPTDLDRLEDGVGLAAIDTVIVWATAALTVDAMVRTAQDSANKVTELVAAIKAYSHMDEASYQEVDIHDGLESTLTILGCKLKSGVTVVRNYDRSLPRIGVYGGELNQVWTNLIDNAIDAIEGEGTITLHTAKEAEYVLVEVIDNGPGIADVIVPRIFDPFFTTKPVGKGTGLGLEISHQIVVRHHHGDIRVVSKPGDTRFQVRLPIRQPGDRTQ